MSVLKPGRLTEYAAHHILVADNHITHDVVVVVDLDDVLVHAALSFTFDGVGGTRRRHGLSRSGGWLTDRRRNPPPFFRRDLDDVDEVTGCIDEGLVEAALAT